MWWEPGMQKGGKALFSGGGWHGCSACCVSVQVVLML